MIKLYGRQLPILQKTIELYIKNAERQETDSCP